MSEVGGRGVMAPPGSKDPSGEAIGGSLPWPFAWYSFAASLNAVEYLDEASRGLAPESPPPNSGTGALRRRHEC